MADRIVDGAAGGASAASCPDGDVPLDLQAALGAIYDEAAYDLSVDYGPPPPPPAFSEAEVNWVEAQTETCSQGSVNR